MSDAPIIFLSCKTQEIDKIMALSAGGDDYMTKPFMPGELIARIKAHLRRSSSNAVIPEEQKYKFDDYTIDFDSYELLHDGKEINITTKEMEILRLLISNPRKVFSVKQIFEAVWKTVYMENDSNTVMVYIRNIRKKIEKDPNKPKYIINVRGVGYKFNRLPDTE